MKEALFTLILLIGLYSSAQAKVERQHRIKKTQFPDDALAVLAKDNQNVKRLKFYREVDTATIIYTAKFKKARLFYEMDFDKDGASKAIAFEVKQVDIPKESFDRMSNYVLGQFQKSKTRKILQSYPLEGQGNDKATLRNAFQNLLVPNMGYIVLVRGKIEGKSADYKLIFDAEGNFKAIRESLPANYDHVLY